MSADHTIICVHTEEPHGHVTLVGIGTYGFAPAEILDVGTVRQMLDAKVTFETADKLGRTVRVRKARCKADGCTVRTIKTEDDGTLESDLGHLDPCGP